MHVTFGLTRGDIARLNVYVFLRTKANWITLGVIAVGFVIWELSKLHPSNPAVIAFIVVGGLFVGASGLVAAFLYSLVTILLKADKRSGSLGERSVTLTSEGLENKTTASSGIVKCSAIRSIRNADHYILFEFTSRIFFLVPKRTFMSTAECDSFVQMANQLHNSALIEEDTRASNSSFSGTAS